MPIHPHLFAVEGLTSEVKKNLLEELLLLDIVVLREPTLGHYGKKALQMMDKLPSYGNTHPFKYFVQSSLILQSLLKDREQNQKRIQNHLNNGKKVVMDRYILSMLAYQGILFSQEFLLELNKGFLFPHTVFFIDTKPDNKELNLKVYKNYLKGVKLLEEAGVKVVMLNEDRAVDEVKNYI